MEYLEFEKPLEEIILQIEKAEALSDEEDVDVESVIALVKRNAKLARTIITRSVSQIEGKSPFSCILKTSIISDLKSISKETLSRLELLVGKYINLFEIKCLRNFIHLLKKEFLVE